MDIKEIFETLAEATRRQATEPNIHAYDPHQKQILFHSAPQRHRLYIGGNRSGKTTGGVTEDIWWSQGNHPFRETPPPPVHGRVCSVDFINGIQKIILPQNKRWLPPSYLKNGSWEDSYDKQERLLTFANGSTIEFMSYDQKLDKFSGTSRHWTHFDEEPPQDIFVECLLRLVDRRGSWWMTLTPVQGMEWMYDEIYLPGRNDPDGSNIAVIEVEMRDNPHLSTDEIEELERAIKNEEDRQVRIKGEFIRRGGLVYKSFDPRVHVIDSLTPEQLDSIRSWRWFASLDHGFNNPTAWLWHAVSPDNEIITFWEHYKAGMTVVEHANIVKDVNVLLQRVPDIYVADPAIAQRNAITGASIQTEYAINGIPIALGVNDVLSGVNRVNQYLALNKQGKPSWYITRNCEKLIWEIQRLKWKTWATKEMERKNNLFDQIHKKDDHACDSARYFFTMMPDLTPFKPIVDEDEHRRLAKALLNVGVNAPEDFTQRIDHTLRPPVAEINSEGWNIKYQEDSVGFF